MKMIKLHRLQFNDRLQLLLRFAITKVLSVARAVSALSPCINSKCDHFCSFLPYISIALVSPFEPFISIGNAERKLLVIVFVYHFRFILKFKKKRKNKKHDLVLNCVLWTEYL